MDAWNATALVIVIGLVALCAAALLRPDLFD